MAELVPRPHDESEELKQINRDRGKCTPEEIAAELADLFLFKLQCLCTECLSQYRDYKSQDHIMFAYLGHLEDTEASDLATKYTISIINDLNFLRNAIQLHGDSLLKRWRRRTSTKRRDLLLQVSPNLQPTNNPLIDLGTRLAGKSMSEQEKHRHAYLLPCLNLDCLSADSSNLVKLLHHRASFPPHSWVVYDNAVIQAIWKTGVIREKTAEGCITMSGCHFGHWKALNADEVHRGEAYGAPRALLILEAQSHLLQFLRKVCVAILGDDFAYESRAIDASTSVSLGPINHRSCPKWISLINSESQPKEDVPWRSLSWFYASVPFSPPPSFDIDIMIEIAQNQASEAQDELWLLQTDPAYFYEVASYHEAKWSDFTDLRPFSQAEKYSNIAYIMTLKIAIRARDWQWLLDECREVKQLLDSSEKMTLDKHLPPRYSNVLCILRGLLRKNHEYYRKNLMKSVVRSEAFRKTFEVTHIRDPREPGWEFRLGIKNWGTLYLTDRTAWCLLQIIQYESPFSFPPDQVFQHLDEHLRRSPKQESQRIDREINSWISDLAANEAMATILKYHRPKFQSKKAEKGEVAPHYHKSWLQIFAGEKDVPDTPDTTSLGLDEPILPLKKFKMPSGPKNQAWFQKRDEAHRSLRVLWQAARKAYQMMYELKRVKYRYIEPQLDQMKQGESDEHLQQLELEKQEILSRLNVPKARTYKDDEFVPFATSSIAAPKEELPLPLREKVKTRPNELADPCSPPPTTASEARPQSTPPILYEIQPNCITHRILALLFPEPDDDPNKECLDWLDFVTAMSEFGFRAEHRGGSAFTFKGDIKLPTTTQEDEIRVRSRSINFHMPHPSTEMSPVLLRNMGRRLNRRFGWERAHFGIRTMES